MDKKTTDEALQDSRALISELGCPILYELGFAPAVDWLTRQTERRHGIPLHFHDDGRPQPLNDDVCVLLFKGVRELLANVVRHARAHKANVSIAGHNGAVKIHVEDDGTGFDPVEIGHQVSQNGRFGLFSIRECLEPLGGGLEVA